MSKELSILNSQRLSYTEKSPWLPSKNIENLCNSNEHSSVDEIGNLMGHENIVNEIEEAERTKLNLEMQLSNVRKVHKERYYKTHFHKIKDSSFNSLADNREVNSDLCKKNEGESDNYDYKKATCNIKKKSKKIIKKSILVLGDSMLNGIEESKLSKSRYIRVQPVSGATIKVIDDCLDDVLNDELETIILLAGTNDATKRSAQEIFDDLMILKSKIENILPTCSVIISQLIKRTDNRVANRTIEAVNLMINSENIIQIDNSNINENHLGKRGLHLNEQGNSILAANLLHKIRSQY